MQEAFSKDSLSEVWNKLRGVQDSHGDAFDRSVKEGVIDFDQFLLALRGVTSSKMPRAMSPRSTAFSSPSKPHGAGTKSPLEPSGDTASRLAAVGLPGLTVTRRGLRGAAPGSKASSPGPSLAESHCPPRS